MSLASELSVMALAGGGWTATGRDADVLEADVVMQALIDSNLCKTLYSAGLVTTYVARDVGLDLVGERGKFYKRSRASLDKWIAEYADGNTGPYNFGRFRDLMASSIGTYADVRKSRSYAVVPSVIAMQLGGRWSLNNKCWFGEFSDSWGSVNAVSGFVIKGLWSASCMTEVIPGVHSIDGGYGVGRWGGLYAVDNQYQEKNTACRIVCVPLRNGGVWCFNWYRYAVGEHWDNGVTTRTDYSTRVSYGGEEVLKRDLQLLGGPGYVAQTVRGWSMGSYLNAGGGFAVQFGADPWGPMPEFNGIESMGETVADFIVPKDLLCLDYNAGLANHRSDWLVRDRSMRGAYQDDMPCDECGNFQCDCEGY